MSDPALIVLYRNRGLDATWTATSAVPTLPARNLANANRGKVWRSTGLGNPDRLVADFGTAVALDGIALVGGNFTTAATLAIKLNVAAAWGAPAHTFALVPWDVTNTGVLLALFGATYTYRYLALEITDLANPDGYYELGVPFPSPAFVLPRGEPHEFAWGIVDPSKVSRATDNTPMTEKRLKYAVAQMGWHNLAEAVVFGEVQTMLRTLGISDDAVLSVFSGDPDDDDASKSLNLYGRFDDLPQFEFSHRNPQKGNVYDWGPVTFRESGAVPVA